MSSSTALANVITIIHFIIVFFVVTVPFSTTVPVIYFLHILFSFNIFIHWAFNSDVCSLSLIESQLRNIPYDKSFTYSIISPVFKISKKQWTSVCYIVIIILMILSTYKLVNNKNFQLAKEEYNRRKEKILAQTNKTQLTFKENIVILLHCSKYMFTNKYNSI